MAFESQNKLVSSFNTDNVKQGLFRYKGNTSISNIRGVSNGFTNLVSPELNAGSFYKQANELLEVAVKGATQIKTVQNEEDELKQSIDASRELSTAYQTMQIKKEEALTAVDKQRVIDEFRDDVYAWTTQLTDRNKNSIESATHNFLNFEAREQARLVRKENVTELQNTMNNTSSFLLSSKPEDRNATLNAMRESYNKLGFTNEEFNEVAFSSLSNNLFSGITKDNISREALYTIENTAKSFLNDFKELEGSKAYNDTLKTVEAFRGALIDRDISYVNRAIQLGDSGTFNHYNEVMFKNGDITDIEYRQNKIAFNQKMEQTSRTPKATYEQFKEQLSNNGVNAEDVSLDVIKQTKLLDDGEFYKLEIARTNNIYEELLNPNTDYTKLGNVANKDPKLFEKAVKTYADNNRIVANRLIANMYEIKDPTSQAYQENAVQLQAIMENTKKLTNNPKFIAFTSDNNEAVKNLSYLKELSVVTGSSSLSQTDKIDYLYKNSVDRVNKVEVDTKEVNKVKTSIKETLTKEFGATTYNKNAKEIDILVQDKVSRGLPSKDIIELSKDVYKGNKLNSIISTDNTTHKSLFGKLNPDTTDRIDEYLLSENYNLLTHNSRTHRLQDSLNKGEISPEVFNQRAVEIADKTTKDMAIFNTNLKAMRKKAIDEDKPLSIEYDDKYGLVVITNGEDVLPTNLNINDPSNFVQSFNDFSGVSYLQETEDDYKLQEINNVIGGVATINNQSPSKVKTVKKKETDKFESVGGVGIRPKQ